MNYKPSIIQIDNTSRISFAYDSNGKEICKIKQKYIPEKLYPFKANLFNDNRVEYEYDNNGNLLTELYQTWKNNTWLYTNRISYVLDSSGNLLKVLWQLWIDNEWVNSARTNYTLDFKGNRLKELYEVCTDDSWKDSTRTICTLDNNGNMILEITEHYNNDRWTNSIKTEYTYDNNGNLQSFKKFVWDYFMKVKWDKSSWLRNYIKTDTYDHNKRLLTSEEIGGNGENSRRHSTNLVYDDYGILLYQEDEIGKAKYKTEYTYDSNGNCIQVDCDLSTLSKLFINCYISYNSGQDIYKLPLDSYSQITIEYISI